jgi:uncharacterized protein YyaL (SSP411 family)
VAPNVRQISDSLDHAWYQNRAGNFDMNKLDKVAIATAHIATCSTAAWWVRRNSRTFPRSELIWRAYLRLGMQQFLSLTAGHARQYGPRRIYDHVGGVIARYAVDDQWLIPHSKRCCTTTRSSSTS